MRGAATVDSFRDDREWSFDASYFSPVDCLSSVHLVVSVFLYFDRRTEAND